MFEQRKPADRKPAPAGSLPAGSRPSIPDAIGAQGTIASASAAGNTRVDPAGPLAAAGQSRSAPVPTEFGRYRILRSLGQGAMGVVFLADDTQLGRQVALKIPQLGDVEHSSRLERFYREARLAATLRHPNICPVHDVGEFQGTHFISIAYIEGKPLSAVLKPDKPLSERQAAGVIRKIASALHEAHTHGVIHRDLKPANIMIDRRGEPIVMDFGLARQVNGLDQAHLTQSGAILGTPSYMSPEQVAGDMDSVGPASDIYSLGVILYQLLTNQLPFRGPVVSVLTQIATQTPAPPSAHRPDLDPDLEAICLKAMSRAAGDRCATMAEFASALTQFLRRAATGSSAAAPPAADAPSTILTPDPAPPSIAEPQPVPPSSGFGARWQRLSAMTRRAIAAAAVLVLLAGVAFLLHRIGRDSNSNGEGTEHGEIASLAARSNPTGVSGFPNEPVEAQSEPLAPPDEAGTLIEPTEGETPTPDEAFPDEPSPQEFDAAESDAVPEAAGDPGTVAPEEAANDGDAAAAPKGKKRPARKPPPDPFPEGSTWKGRMQQRIAGLKDPIDGQMTLVVTKRLKNRFEMTVEINGGKTVYRTSGTIRKNLVEWTTDKADVVNGTVGRHHLRGTITNGERLELEGSGRDVTGKATVARGSAHKQ